MKILILGGAGVMGSGGARLLTTFPDVEKIVLADLNKDAVDAMAKDINSPLIETTKVNALNKEELTNLVQQFDVVLNCIGPFNRFGVPILETIIEAGVNYVDVCDDHDATEDLLKLHDKAEKAGVTALICMGTTPGVSNMQALWAVESLEEIINLVVCWAVGEPTADMVEGTPLEQMVGQDPKDTLSPAVWEHMIHVTESDVPIWKDGKRATMPAFESGQYIDFVEPLGRTESYFLGHPEPVTLPLYIDVKGYSACLGALNPGVMDEIRLEARGHKDALHPPVKPDTPLWEAPEVWKKRKAWGGQAAIAEGKEGDEFVRYTVRYMMSSMMDSLVYQSVGQAVGTYFIGKKMVDKKGVFAPEAILDKEKFFDEVLRIQNLLSGTNFTKEELFPIEREVIEAPTKY